MFVNTQLAHLLADPTTRFVEDDSVLQLCFVTYRQHIIREQGSKGTSSEVARSLAQGVCCVNSIHIIIHYHLLIYSYFHLRGPNYHPLLPA